MSMKKLTALVLLAGAAAVPVAAQGGRFEACRYDGGKIEGSVRGLTESAARAGVIARILRYTGLPANFQVMESPEVPNAAAVILRGEDGLLKRVIAYNDQFMEEVSGATRTHWAGTSILAHEIGHHLCGHTLLPGGSQPPSELEADSFSGFVLAKMGASLGEAQQAMRTFGSDSGSDSHPPKRARLDAIAAGFGQAKEIEAPTATSGSRTGEEPAPAAAEKPQPRTGAPASGREQPKPRAAATGGAPGRVDLDSILSASIPLKLDRFVYDEIGAMRPQAAKALNDRLAEHAARHNVEVIVVFARSLRGKTANDLADHLMRQLSVGQADVSNGGCVLYCPPEKANAVRFMPGLIWSLGLSVNLMDVLTEQYVQLANTDPQFLSSLGTPEWMEGHITQTVDSVFTSTSEADWSIRYTSLADAIAADDAAKGKLARIFGVVTSASGAPHKEGTPPNYSGWDFKEAEILAEGGRHLTVRVLPQTMFQASKGDKVAIFGRLASLFTPTIELNSYAKLAR
jgi:hypothetical protein